MLQEVNIFKMNKITQKSFNLLANYLRGEKVKTQNYVYLNKIYFPIAIYLNLFAKINKYSIVNLFC